MQIISGAFVSNRPSNKNYRPLKCVWQLSALCILVTSCTWHQHCTHTHTPLNSVKPEKEPVTQSANMFCGRFLKRSIYIFRCIFIYAVFLYSHNAFCIRVFGVAFSRFAYVQCSNRTIHQSHCVCQPRNTHSECYMITL